jgi:hypothetical protein
MKSCTKCLHYDKLQSGQYDWEDLPCAHCTSAYARQRSESVQRRQIVKPARIEAPGPDDYIARRTVLAWTHVARTYPAAAAYILAKLSDQSLSYAGIAKRFKVSKSTVQYQISLAIMSEPDLAGLISVDHTRNARKAHRRPRP